jgi:hypothetical protein
MSHEGRLKPEPICSVTTCRKEGIEIQPGDDIVLCRHHRKRYHHLLWEIYQSERAQQEKDREARMAAYQAAGSRSQQMDPRKGSTMRSEISGGQFESNRRKH